MSNNRSARNSRPTTMRIAPTMIPTRFVPAWPPGADHGDGDGGDEGGGAELDGDEASTARSEPEPDPVGAAGSGSVVTAASVPGGLGQLVLDRPEGRLRPRREAELAEDVRDVGPGGPLRDEQGRPDLLVAHPLAEQPEDVLLAIGQRLDRLIIAGLLRPHPLGEEPGDG